MTKHLSDFKQPPVLTRVHDDATFESHPAGRPIAIRDLLTNTSGIGYAFSNAALAKLDAAGQPQADLPLVHEPGEKWTYGSSTAVIGRGVERVSGQTLDAFFQHRIFDPLDMRDALLRRGVVEDRAGLRAPGLPTASLTASSFVTSRTGVRLQSDSSRTPL